MNWAWILIAALVGFIAVINIKQYRQRCHCGRFRIGSRQMVFEEDENRLERVHTIDHCTDWN